MYQNVIKDTPRFYIKPKEQANKVKWLGDRKKHAHSNILDN